MNAPHSHAARRRCRRHLSLALLATAATLVGASPALSGAHVTNTRWKNCDTLSSGIRVTATFTDVAAVHGPGR